MKKLIRTVLALAIFLIPAFGLVYWWEMPRLEAVSPPAAADSVPAATSLRLTFSRPMQLSSLRERLSTEPASQGNFRWEGNTLVFTPSKPWPTGATVKVKLASGGKSTGLFGLTLRQDSFWSFTIGQPRLAYLYPSSGPANIYALSPSTSQTAPLTDLPGGVQDFQVNASGNALYYSIRDGQTGSQVYRLDLAEPEGGTPPKGTNPAEKPALVLDCPQALCESLAVSPDEKYLAYERMALPGAGEPGFPQVWLLPLELASSAGPGTPAPTQAAPKPAGNPIHQTLQPAWSAEGLLVFYDKNDEALIMVDANGNERARFTNLTGQPGAWSPNGQSFIAPEIIVPAISSSITGLEQLSSSHLIVYAWQDSSAHDLTPGAELEDAEPAFSPDGATLAFARKYLDVKSWTPGRQIWLKKMGSGEAHQLTNDPNYNHFDFAWSPNGDQLAYMRFNQTAQTEPPEIWLTSLSTGQSARLVTGGYSPQWIP